MRFGRWGRHGTKSRDVSPVTSPCSRRLAGGCASPAASPRRPASKLCLSALLRLGRSGGTRTHGPRFWRPMLYQLSYTPKPPPPLPPCLAGRKGMAADKRHAAMS